MAHKTEPFTLTNCKLAFPHLDTPKTGDFPGAQPKYQAAILVPKSQTAAIAKLKAMINEVLDVDFADKAKRTGLKYGLKDGDRPNGNGNIPNGYAGHYVVSVSSLYQPLLVDKNLSKVIDVKGKFYPGCLVNVQVNAYSFDKKANRGVTFGVTAVQFAGDGERLAGGPPDAATVFSPVPGSQSGGATGDSPDDFLNASDEPAL